ncbi:hypothetical protein SLE2022_037140 [Rubroshorea leprosula]
MDSSNYSGTSSQTLSVVEHICAALIIPIIAVFDFLVFSFANCFEQQPPHYNKHRYGSEHMARLAHQTCFAVNEVEALYELFKKLSSSIIDDGLIHKEQLQLALFHNPDIENVFLNRVFDLFDENKNGAINFAEFVHGLSVFHRYAPMEEKIDFAFRFHDLRQTGFIEWEDVKQMVADVLMESGIELPDDLLDAIVDKTFADADADEDRRINKEQWKAFVVRNPTLLKNMTLPCLMDVSAVFSSFVFNNTED